MISADDENDDFSEIVGTEYKEPIEWVLVNDYRDGTVCFDLTKSRSVPADAVYSGLTKNQMKQYFTSAYLTHTKNWIKYV